MTIGEHKPKKAKNRCWKDCIGILLDEVTTALEESFVGLSDEQAWRRPVPQRHSIGTMVMHCIESLNGFACWAQVGRGVDTKVNDSMFEMWDFTPQQLDEKQKDKPVPSVQQMAGWVRQVREMALAGLAAASKDDLRGPRANLDWTQRTKRPAGDAYMRCLFHTAAHIRQIWCLRGVMSTFGEADWPQQHYD